MIIRRFLTPRQPAARRRFPDDLKLRFRSFHFRGESEINGNAISVETIDGCPSLPRPLGPGAPVPPG